jgi:hypothetical protein
MANEKRLIDANATNADSCETVRIKTHFAKVIVSIIEGKPYYDILWFDPTDRNYHIGYGSYNLDFVFQWFSKYFEIVDAPTVDAVEVVRCKDCKKWEYDENFSGWCVEWRRRTLGDHFCSYGERRTNV